jgi:hypothetical protein
LGFRRNIFYRDRGIVRISIKTGRRPQDRDSSVHPLALHSHFQADGLKTLDLCPDEFWHPTRANTNPVSQERPWRFESGLRSRLNLIVLIEHAPPRRGIAAEQRH